MINILEGARLRGKDKPASVDPQPPEILAQGRNLYDALDTLFLVGNSMGLSVNFSERNTDNKRPHQRSLVVDADFTVQEGDELSETFLESWKSRGLINDFVGKNMKVSIYKWVNSEARRPDNSMYVSLYTNDHGYTSISAIIAPDGTTEYASDSYHRDIDKGQQVKHAHELFSFIGGLIQAQRLQPSSNQS